MNRTHHTEFLEPHRAKVINPSGKRVALPDNALRIEFDLNQYGTIIRAWAHRLGGRVTDLSDKLYGHRLEVLSPHIDYRDPV